MDALTVGRVGGTFSFPRDNGGTQVAERPGLRLPQERGDLSLHADLVPETAWYSNLRSLLSAQEWDALRKAVYARAENKCECCGGKGQRHPVEAHERWSYDEKTGVQTLADVVAFCPPCHEASHIGLAEERGNLQTAAARIMDMNGWSRRETQEHLTESKDEWLRRSDIEWRTDVSWIFKTGLALSDDTLNRIVLALNGIPPQQVLDQRALAAKPAPSPKRWRKDDDGQR